MKKLILLLSFLTFQLSSDAQSEFYSKLKSLIQEKHPEIDLSQKLIGCVVWSINDAESRDQNKSFERTMNVYENAKLKGGSKGVVFLSVNKENLSAEANIILQKDGIVKLFPIKIEELKDSDLESIKNIVFDSAGYEVYRDLSNPTIYSSINKLITR